MWYVWFILALVSRAQGGGAGEGAGAVATTTRSPPRTLDRQAGELAWRSWLQSPESRDPNAPPRRITTKSLFITPLVCPKGQRLDRDGCVQVVSVNKDEHERFLLEQLNALLTSANDGDMIYDYGDEEPGPLQLSIPIGLEPQASPLQGQDESAQTQDVKPNHVEVTKKEDKPIDLSIEAELELLKLENNKNNKEANSPPKHPLNNFISFPEKPKRDSGTTNITTDENIKNSTDEGQKEMVFGNVSIDPILYITEQNQQRNETSVNVTIENNETNNSDSISTTTIKSETINILNDPNKTDNNMQEPNTDKHELKDRYELIKPEAEKIKLNPETDYSDIGEAIKLISRYAEVTTDDNFTKDQNKYAPTDDGILGTRTKLQHRRNKFKLEVPTIHIPSYQGSKRVLPHRQNNGNFYYRYPMGGPPTPPPDYPFRHLQDYWPDRRHISGLYNNGHENPRRHHHSFPHNAYRPQSYSNYPDYIVPYTGSQIYPGQHPNYTPTHRLVARHTNPGGGFARNTNNQDLYSLLGLKHWFSNENAAKR